MSDNTARDIVDFASEDKPNKAADAFDDGINDRLAALVGQKTLEVANQMVGQEYEEPELPAEEEQDEGEEEQLELDVAIDEPSEDESDEYESDQELISEPEEDSEEQQEDEDEET
jgi:hypothetical protein